MVATHSTFELLRLSEIRDILRSRGPCITILLPPYRPGEPAGSGGAILKSNISEVARQLAERGLSKSGIASLLQPLEQLTANPGMAAGSHWSRAILLSPTVFQ